MRSKFALLITVFIVACSGPKSALDGVSTAGVETLFSKTDRGAAFMGAFGGVTPSCDPTAMEQGYVFRRDAKKVWLDSLRPSGVISHNIAHIIETERGFDVEGVNGAGVPFTLGIIAEGDQIYKISWDGAQPQTFLRCTMAPAQ